MNVIVSNKQKDIIDNANIDAIKDLNGLFYVDDLISKFKNYFFSKMILDATSIVDFTKDEVLTKLVNEIGAEKLFILLPSNPEPPKEFTDKLKGYGIYNYSNKIEDIIKYLDSPNTNDNTYETNTFQNDDLYQDNSIYNTSSDTSLTDALNNIDLTNVEEKHEDYDVDNSANTELNNSEINNEINNNLDETSESININRSDYEFYVAKEENSNNIEEESNVNINKKYILGLKNVTSHAGSTTLIYMLLKKLDNNACAIEINKDDFKYFHDNRMMSINERDIDSFLNNNKNNIILVDLNNCQNTSFCNEVLYLVEPSIIKLNRLMMENRLTFRELQFKKIVLNKSLLSENDVDALSKEAGVQMYFNMPPVNDRLDNKVIDNLIKKLGL